MKLAVIFALSLITLNTQAAPQFSYKIGHFKKSGKIAERTITRSSNMLKQNYDLQGNLIIEISVSRHSTSSSCYLSGTKRTGEEYFFCLESYQRIVSSEGGIIEGTPRTSKTSQDIQFTDTGKNLQSGK